MRGGLLRHYVTITQNVGLTEDGSGQDCEGQRIDDWQLVAGNVPAEVLALSGQESQRGQQIEAGATTRVKMRFPTSYSVSPNMQITHASRTLNIAAAYDPDGRGRELWCDCKETS